MTEKEFNEKWGNVDIEALNEEDYKAFKDDCFEMYETTGFSRFFHSPYEERRMSNGKRFQVIRRAKTGESAECHIEVQPMWLVKIEGSEEPVFCYPEEICKKEELNASLKEAGKINDLRQELYWAIVNAIIGLIGVVGEKLPVRLLYRYIDDDCEQSLLRVTEVYVKNDQLWMTVASDKGDSYASDVHFDYDEDFESPSSDNLSVMHSDKTAFDLDFIQALYEEVNHYALPRELEKRKNNTQE